MAKKKQALIGKVAQLEQLTQRLNDPKVSTDDKKGIVIELAHMGTADANKVLGEFKKNHSHETDEELNAFAKLALEEGSFMAASDEDLIKKAVWDEKNDNLVHYYADTEERQCRIDEWNYEIKIVKRLAKKAPKDEKENWKLQEIALQDLVSWDEHHKQEAEEKIKETEAILKEIEAELPENLRNANWHVGGSNSDPDDICSCCK